MKSTLKLVVLGCGLALLQGCATYPNQHGGASTGVRGNFDLDVLGVGVDGGAQLGVHRAGVGRGGILGGVGGVNAPPCDRTLAAMESSEGLIAWASNGGQGMQTRRAQANASESAGRAGYNCNAQNMGQSIQVNSMEQNGQSMPGGMIAPQQDYPTIQQQGQRSYYGR